MLQTSLQTLGTVRYSPVHLLQLLWRVHALRLAVLAAFAESLAGHVRLPDAAVAVVALLERAPAERRSGHAEQLPSLEPERWRLAPAPLPADFGWHVTLLQR